MSRHHAAPTAMNQPVDPDVSNPAPVEARSFESSKNSPTFVATQASFLERIFRDTCGVRAGWRVFLYFALAAVIYISLEWLGGSLFRNPTGPSRLWEQFYNECALFLAAVLPAAPLARIECRRFHDYGLPVRNAFGNMFWVGAVWGFIWISALLLLMHTLRVFDSGEVALHGARILRFAVFWWVYFVIVGLFEEFLLRGYLLFTVAKRIGFWPAALLMSAIFGAIHLNNKNETFVGALGAGVIGLFFCFTLWRTGTLWFAVGFHAAWDWGETFFYGVPDSGTTEPGHYLTPRFHGPAWLTGGIVGPEASALLLLVVVAMWLAFDRRYRQARFLERTPAQPVA